MDEDELFNPEYVEVDRVLDMSVVTDPVTKDETVHYLVKWRGLPYEDSTWELSQDVERLEQSRNFLEDPWATARRWKTGLLSICARL